jgi:hypothetical protein
VTFFIHKSKIRATTAKIQTTRLLVKLERLEIILFNYYGKACDLELALGCKNYAGLKK